MLFIHLEASVGRLLASVKDVTDKSFELTPLGKYLENVQPSPGSRFCHFCSFLSFIFFYSGQGLCECVCVRERERECASCICNFFCVYACACVRLNVKQLEICFWLWSWVLTPWLHKVQNGSNAQLFPFFSPFIWFLSLKTRLLRKSCCFQVSM